MQFSPRLRWCVLVSLFLLGVGGAKLIAESFAPAIIYHKEFVQEYLLARAVLAGVNPYQPVPELAQRLAVPLPQVLPHPTPHTPALAVLSAPLGFFSYQTAALLWLALETVFLLLALRRLLHWCGWPLNVWWCGALTWGLLTWWPVYSDLINGQINSLLLWLLVQAWLALRAGQDGRGGAWLGVLLAVKLLAWPLVIFLAWRRRWRGVAAAAGVALAWQLAAVLVLGGQAVKDYYLHAGPAVSAFYRTYAMNYSAWSLGARLFAGTWLLDLGAVPPLWAAPLAAKIVAVAAPLLLLAGGLVLAARARSFDTAFGLLTLVNLLVNPVAWHYYLLMAALPLAVAARSWAAGGWPKTLKFGALAALALLSLSPHHIGYLLSFFTLSAADGARTALFPVALLTWAPALAVLSWLGVLWRVDQLAQEPDSVFSQPVSGPEHQSALLAPPTPEHI